MPLAIDPGYPCVRITWPPPDGTEDLYRVHKTGNYEEPEPDGRGWVRVHDPEELGVFFVASDDVHRVRLFYEGPPRTVEERQNGVVVRTGAWGPC